jgi:hypothetical protein
MSHDIVKWAISQKVGRSSAKLVLIAMASYCVFRPKNATQSDAKKPLNPIQKNHRFRSEPYQ